MYGTRVCTHTCMYVLNSRILNQRSKEIFIFIYIKLLHVPLPLPLLHTCVHAITMVPGYL